MKTFFLFLLLLFLTSFSNAQLKYVDSLHQQLLIEKNDTNRLVLFYLLNDYYVESRPDSALFYGKLVLQVARQLELKLYEASAMDLVGYSLMSTGNYSQAMLMILNGIALAEDKEVSEVLPYHYLRKLDIPEVYKTRQAIRDYALANLHQDLGHIYTALEQYDKALEQYFIVKNLVEKYDDKPFVCSALMNIGRTYTFLDNYDQALLYEKQAYNLAIKINFERYFSLILNYLGNIYLKQNKLSQANKWFQKAVNLGIEQENLRGLIVSYNGLANVFLHLGQTDSSLWYAHNSLQLANSLATQKNIYIADTLLSSIYKTRGPIDSAFYYQAAGIKQKDELFNTQKIQEVQNIINADKQRRADIEAARTSYRKRLQLNALLVGFLFLLVFAFILFRNNRQRQKANFILREQKAELETTLKKLKAAQTQLVQREKMASLGELTAGIAHEIQNPLNFINNFSEVNREMLKELKAERVKPKAERDDNLESEIIDNVITNSEKINHHGKRADNIVKGMLQHSRVSAGQKELTDINALCDEYLRLSYHGMQAKDKSFNAAIKTEFDASIGKISIVPQDIGRVLLNLFNNAFYAVNEKRKLSANSYGPIVEVKTRKLYDKVEIIVNDNGNGIPQNIIDKIFQPFFTTKPTGQGTGLGLSISYDIIKAHGGEITVESKEGEGSEFIIKINLE